MPHVRKGLVNGMQLEAGKKVKGVVTGITDFGAFVKLEDGSVGMIHISQVSDSYVSDIKQFLSVGQEVEPTVLFVNEKGRIALSLKTGKQPQRTREKPSSGQPILYESAPKPTSFEDMLSRYKSASEEKISDLRKMAGNGRNVHKRRGK